MPAMSIPRAHMSLSNYCERMGVIPLHFFGGSSASVFNVLDGCSSVWMRHPWQADDNVSHEDLAFELVDAERTLFEFLGYPVHPQWINIEMPYPSKSGSMYNGNGYYHSVATQIGYVHDVGARATESIATDLAVSYDDADGDGFDETATVDVSALDQSGWYDDYGSILVVPSGYGEEFAIDRVVSISATTITIRTWNLIDPEIASRFPSNDILPINLDIPGNRVSSVDLIREYNDPTGGVTFKWDGYADQTGTAYIVDSAAGVIRLKPADTTSCVGRPPDKVRISLYAGFVADDYWNVARGKRIDVDPVFAETIRFLATARLNRDLCGCNNLVALGKDLRQDMALISPQGNFLAVADVIQECPFGTRRGEWLAWNRVRHFGDKYHSVAVV